MFKDKGYVISLFFALFIVAGTFTDPYSLFPAFNLWDGVFFLQFIDPLSIIIVFGGCTCATIMHFSASKAKLAFAQVGKLMQYVNMDLRTELEMLTLFARRVRSNGILSIDDDVDHMYSCLLYTSPSPRDS